MSEPSARILLVEDEPEVRTIVESVLSSFGYTVKAVANGAEALDAMEETQPDLILSDVRMPIIDGFQLLQRIRADPVWHHTPFIIVSAKAESASRSVPGRFSTSIATQPSGPPAPGARSSK